MPGGRGESQDAPDQVLSDEPAEHVVGTQGQGTGPGDGEQTSERQQRNRVNRNKPAGLPVRYIASSFTKRWHDAFLCMSAENEFGSGARNDRGRRCCAAQRSDSPPCQGGMAFRRPSL